MIGTDKLKVNHISAIRGTTFLKNQYPKQAKSIAYAPQPAPNCRRSVKQIILETVSFREVPLRTSDSRTISTRAYDEPAASLGCALKLAGPLHH